MHKTILPPDPVRTEVFAMPKNQRCTPYFRKVGNLEERLLRGERQAFESRLRDLGLPHAPNLKASHCWILPILIVKLFQASHSMLPRLKSPTKL